MESILCQYFLGNKQPTYSCKSLKKPYRGLKDNQNNRIQFQLQTEGETFLKSAKIVFMLMI